MSSIAVVGAGYVGLASAVGLAHLGHRVIAYDNDQTRIDTLGAGMPPFFEERLEELLNEGIARGRLSFAHIDDADLSAQEFVFLCLPTPQGADGGADLSAFMSAAATISPTIAPNTIIVNKSTVPVGTARELARLLARRDISIVSNPEFLQEGRALTEFLGGERIVIGSDDPQIAERVAQLYAGTGVPTIIVGLESAELAKYACNSFLATKLSFINAIALLCERMDADVTEVASVMRSDSRIGSKYLSPGPAWGGPCFPKDTEALLRMSTIAGFDFGLLAAAIHSNDAGIAAVIAKVESMSGCSDLANLPIAVWGLTFKAGTDDVRQSPALRIVEALVERGATVTAFDPMVSSPAGSFLVVDDALKACVGAQVLIVLTEWPEFASIDLSAAASVMGSAALIDTRNIVSREAASAAGFRYIGTGLRELAAQPQADVSA